MHTWFWHAFELYQRGYVFKEQDWPIITWNTDGIKVLTGECRIWRSLVFKWLFRIRCDAVSEQLNTNTQSLTACFHCAKQSLQLAVAWAAHSVSASWHLSIHLRGGDAKAVLTTLTLEGQGNTGVCIRKILKFYIHLQRPDLWNHKISKKRTCAVSIRLYLFICSVLIFLFFFFNHCLFLSSVFNFLFFQSPSFLPCAFDFFPSFSPSFLTQREKVALRVQSKSVPESKPRGLCA